jgi:hypothetical protein
LTKLYHPLPFGHARLTGADPAPIQPEPDTELNYDLPPQRVPRPRTFNLRMMAGLFQWSATQWFYSAFLPPLPVPRATNTARSIGGVLGAGTVAQATSHVPSARVPRSIT